MSDLRWPDQDRFVCIGGHIAAAIVDLAQIIVCVVVVILQPPIKITLARDQRNTLGQLHVEGTHGTVSPRIGAEGTTGVMCESRDQQVVPKVTLGFQLALELLWDDGSVFVLDRGHGTARPGVLGRSKLGKPSRRAV